MSTILESVIPVRLAVPDNNLKALLKVGQAGKQSGDDVDKGMKRAKDSINVFAMELAALTKVQMGLQINGQVANVISEELKRAAKYTKETAKEFIQLRQAIQQIAALISQKNENEFALGQVRAATKANLTPVERLGFQKQFQSYAGAYFEDDQQRLDKRQVEEYKQKITKFAKAQGISAEEAVQLGGDLLQFNIGPQETQALLDRCGKVFKAVESALTSVWRLLPQMPWVTSQGFTPEKTSKMLGIMSEAMPGKEETGVMNALKALTNVRIEGKSEGLGVKNGVSLDEMIEAAARRLSERAAEDDNMDVILQEYAPDFRKRRGLLGFVNRSVLPGEFERIEGYAKETPSIIVQQSVVDDQNSDARRHPRRDANTTLALAEHSKANAALEQFTQDARIQLSREGRFEDVLAQRIQAEVGRISGTSVEDQLTSERAMVLAQQRVGVSGAQLGTREGDSKFRINIALGAATSDTALRELLKQIEKNKQLTYPPLSAPPQSTPDGGRMGGG
jgi:hypothetical protein